MAQIPNMNWMGDQPSGSAYDVYQYYLGGGSPGGTSTPSTGGGISSLPWYQQTGGGDGGGFNLPQNYYKAPMTVGYGEGMVDPPLAAHLPQDNKVKNYLQKLNFPGKQLFAGAGNLIKKGVGSLASLAGGFLPKMDPAHAGNLRWAVDDAGYGTGSQRDQFGMLTGQSLMDPDRTYEDRLAEKEEELNKIIASQKTRGTYKKSGRQQKQLDHIKSVEKIQEQERIKKEQTLRQQVKQQAAANKAAGDRGGWQSGMAADEAFMSGPAEGQQLSDVMASFQEGGMVNDPEYRGWKKMYEKNPEIGSMHEKHPTFIKFYKKHERDKKKFGGLAGLLYG